MRESSVLTGTFSAWYDMKTNEEVLNNDIFAKIVEALEPFGLHGLDRLYSFMIVTELQQFTKFTISTLLNDKVCIFKRVSSHYNTLYIYYTHLICNSYAYTFKIFARLTVAKKMRQEIRLKELLLFTIVYESTLSICEHFRR